MIIIIKWLTGLIVSLLLGNFVTKKLVNYLKKKSNLPNLKSYSAELGILEKLVYVLTLVNGYVAFVGIWLGIKMIGRWVAGDVIGVPIIRRVVDKK